MPSRRSLLRAGIAAGFVTWPAGCTDDPFPPRDGPASVPGGPVDERPDDYLRPAATRGPEVFTAGYPRAWFFRQTEDAGLYPSYRAWEQQYEHLNGIQGKAFPEERHLDHALAREYFTRFKQRHPDKLVLLHFNGMGRRPAFNRALFFPGHWLYYAGTHTTRPANPDATGLRVADASPFKLERHPTMFKGMPDDLVIVPPARTGLDWQRAEHARLVEVNRERGTVVVRRGQYGTEPIVVPVGSYLAPVVRHRPPVLSPPEALWVYNLSTTAPRDRFGRRCLDVLVEELAGYFGPDGSCAAFDGVEFDVLFFVPGLAGVAGFVPDHHVIDVDNAHGGARQHGQPTRDGRNAYGLGVCELCRRLREKLPDKIIMADGMLPEVLQRSFGVLNGMESEGFPAHRDAAFADWSGGLNRLRFWRGRGAKPPLSYLVFKYVGPAAPPKPGQDIATYKLVRLALAAAQFTDACFALGSGWAPPADAGATGSAAIQVFDELWLGSQRRPNWLGRAVGAAVHLAGRTPNLLAGGRFASSVEDWRRAGYEVHAPHDDASPGRARVSFRGGAADTFAPDTGQPVYPLRLAIVELAGPDLYVELRLRGAKLRDYPAEVARRVGVRATNEAREGDGRTIYGWFDRRPTLSTFAFRDVGPGPVRLTIEIEGAEQITILRATAHDHPDVMYREFECGLVLANPSGRPFTFDLAELGLTHRYRRLPGTEGQDPITNDGSPVVNRVTVDAVDALFVARMRH